MGFIGGVLMWCGADVLGDFTTFVRLRFVPFTLIKFIMNHCAIQAHACLMLLVPLAHALNLVLALYMQARGAKAGQ